MVKAARPLQTNSSSPFASLERSLERTIESLTSGPPSPEVRALLIEAKRLRSVIANWRSIPPAPSVQDEMLDRVLHLCTAAGTARFDEPEPAAYEGRGQDDRDDDGLPAEETEVYSLDFEPHLYSLGTPEPRPAAARAAYPPPVDDYEDDYRAPRLPSPPPEITIEPEVQLTPARGRRAAPYTSERTGSRQPARYPSDPPPYDRRPSDPPPYDRRPSDSPYDQYDQPYDPPYDRAPDRTYDRAPDRSYDPPYDREPQDRPYDRAPSDPPYDRARSQPPPRMQSTPPPRMLSTPPPPMETEGAEGDVATEITVQQVPLPEAIDPMIVMLKDTYSERADAYRTLRRKLASSGNPRVIAVTSALAGEGKTTLAVNLALVLREAARGRVLLAEANLRAPRLAKLFGFEPPACFAEQLESHRESPASPWIAVEPISKLHVMAIDARIEHAPLLDAVAFSGGMAQLKLAGYDFIVVDSPPVTGSVDCNLIADSVDGMIFSAVQMKSRKAAMKKAIEQIQPAPILGVVVLDSY